MNKTRCFMWNRRKICPDPF